MGQPKNDSGPQHGTSGHRWRVDLHLTVWSADDGWHAVLVGPGARMREFASPFELARCVASPDVVAPSPASPGPGRGLR